MSMLRMSGRLLLRWRRAPPPAAGPDGEDEDEEEQDADADGGWLSAACPPIMAAAAALVGWVGLLGSLVLPFGWLYFTLVCPWPLLPSREFISLSPRLCS